MTTGSSYHLKSCVTGDSHFSSNHQQAFRRIQSTGSIQLIASLDRSESLHGAKTTVTITKNGLNNNNNNNNNT